jgi:hypothetical protein
MPRANRHFLPGHVWHITHRCYQTKFVAVGCTGLTSIAQSLSIGLGYQ